MKKSDVQLSYHQGTQGCPMVNVKNHLWIPDLIAKYKATGVHEYSDDQAFWDWLEECYDEGDVDGWDSADEWARDDCWADAKQAAREIWPHRANGQHEPLAWRNQIDRMTTGPLEIWSAGRSGGWLVVSGLRPLDEWDAIELGRWARFVKAVRAIADEEYPYAYIWNLAANVFEPIRAERSNTYPVPAYVGAAS